MNTERREQEGNGGRDGERLHATESWTDLDVIDLLLILTSILEFPLLMECEESAPIYIVALSPWEFPTVGYLG